jgi:cell pole-organizing protein PopZ
MSAMAEQNAAQEPTMEEILASIRRIISEDDAPASTGATSASAPAAAPVKADSDDVLELTQRAEPSPFAAEPEVAAAPAAEPKKRGKASSPFARFEKGGDEAEEKYDDSRFDTSMFDKTDIELVAPEAEVAPPRRPRPNPLPSPSSRRSPPLNHSR